MLLKMNIPSSGMRTFLIKIMKWAHRCFLLSDFLNYFFAMIFNLALSFSFKNFVKMVCDKLFQSFRWRLWSFCLLTHTIFPFNFNLSFPFFFFMILVLNSEYSLCLLLNELSISSSSYILNTNMFWFQLFDRVSLFQLFKLS